MSNVSADSLSDASREVLRSCSGQAYRRLVVHPGEYADPEIRQRLAALSADQVLSRPPRSREDAEALLAALWLWHDFLEESHSISQRLQSPTGSFWHAIMHRREGDFSNSKYWYARCRQHPVLDKLAAKATEICSSGSQEFKPLIGSGTWEPDSFVDLVARVHDHPQHPLYASAVALQRMEWETLFEHCLGRATGTQA